jgi:hypothetical protein
VSSNIELCGYAGCRCLHATRRSRGSSRRGNAHILDGDGMRDAIVRYTALLLMLLLIDCKTLAQQTPLIGVDVLGRSYAVSHRR